MTKGKFEVGKVYFDHSSCDYNTVFTYTVISRTEKTATIAEKNSLKAKVAEILNRPRKSVIDWKATFDDMKISEILNLQKEFKKFLKLGQIDLAENVFSMLKTLCKNYRAVAA